MTDSLKERLTQIGGCLDGNCLVVKPTGMHTNGGCKCFRNDPIKAERVVRAYKAELTAMAETVRTLEAEREAQDRELARVENSALNLMAEKDAKIATLQGERDRLRERVRLEGVCMSCLDGAPDLSHGCTDCLNTGYERGQSRGDEALTVLQEVKEWIDNWDPNFVQDDEWPETAARIRAALNPTGAGEAG